MTEPTRRLARAADIELKRRSVLGPDDVLKSAEPEGFKYPAQTTATETWVQPRLDGTVDLPRDQPELPLQVSEVAEYNRKRQAEIDRAHRG